MRLLLAEDERALSKALVAILKHNNYSVDAVYDGEEALDYLESEVYDALILDVMMPKIDGFGVLKKIREKGNTIPVLMLTAKSDVDDKVTGLDLGADDYLTKPFVAKELLARIRAITRRREDFEDNSLVFGDIRLDRTTFELVADKGKVLLTSKEFQIMEAFMQSPGKIISAERFMEKVWGFDSDAEINVVWTYISFLRKKLKQIGSQANIKVVRNVGYVLEDKNA